MEMKTPQEMARTQSVPKLEAALKDFKAQAMKAALQDNHPAARFFYEGVEAITQALTLKGATPQSNAITAVLA